MSEPEARKHAGRALRNVSDTALWVAAYRAMESERPDALFVDPYARRLAGERGEAILRELTGDRIGAWPTIVRTAVMDELILRCVDRGVGTVFNLAAGLDVRAFRLPLPPSLRWFDADLPDMVEYRAGHLRDAKPACRHEEVPLDVGDGAALADLFARGKEGGGEAMVITEGLLVYLEAEQVAALAGRVAAAPAVGRWLMDLGSPFLLRMLRKRLGKHLDPINAAMRFGPEEGTGFFAPFGWREAEFRSIWTESLRLKRSARLAWLWNALARLQRERVRERYRRMSGVVLLERADASPA